MRDTRNFSERFDIAVKEEIKKSNKEIADEINIEGVTEKEISWYRTGLAFPDVKVLYALEAKYKVDIVELLIGKRY